MLLAWRAISAVNGLVTVGLVLAGVMTDPLFVVADLFVGVLALAAVLPSKRWAISGMLVGNAYALGVFTVALAGRLAPGGGGASPFLAIAIFASIINLTGLLARRDAV